MRNLAKTLLVLSATLVAGSAMAGDAYCQDEIDFTNNDFTSGFCKSPSGSGASKRTDNKLYMGLVWSFGETVNKTPDVLFGFRSTQVNSANKVSGGDLNFRFQTAKNFALDSVRVAYVGGNREALANVGVGYSFTTGSALFTGAVQTAHVRAGTDYALAGHKFTPYFEVNTLQRIKPTASDLSCAAGNLRTMDHNVTYGLDVVTANGLYSVDAPSAQLLGIPFIPEGTKTCYEVAPG